MALLFNKKGDQLYSGQAMGSVTAWDLAADQPRYNTKLTENNSGYPGAGLCSLSLACDDQTLLSYYNARGYPAIQLWDQRTCRPLRCIEKMSKLHMAAGQSNAAGDRIICGRYGTYEDWVFSRRGYCIDMLAFPEGFMTVDDMLDFCSDQFDPVSAKTLVSPAWAFRRDSKGNNPLHSWFSRTPDLLHDPWMLQILEEDPKVRTCLP